MHNMYIFMKKKKIFNVFQTTVWSQSYGRTEFVDYCLEHQLDWYIDCIFLCVHTTNVQLTHCLISFLPTINIKI